MDIGRLTEWVTLEMPTGPEADGYKSMGRVPVSVEMADSGGTEALRFGSPTAIGYFRITMRYREDIKASWRIVHDDGRVFQISSYGQPPKEPRRSALQVFVTEIQ